MLDALHKSSFDPHLNDRFTIHSEEAGAIEVKLVEIEEKSNEKVECFSLLFRGPLDNILPQKIHRLKHHKLGEMELFVVPITYPKHDGMYYQVVFNRLKSAR
jgi:hypothetical protein